ncbi:methyl-accepting chemotaxis protein [Candidatus Protochlamydia phocaeensis]|uniref:methyl-accepting chemotaxis protein n=1 Tax=Candidatus Protochlamydia phocaeensis TaxID=1414722 RepID=UPI0008389921|nr:methyl-accepting chemotaxis protein [Candidatus Protochlamydia phocaeensis]
MKNATSTTFLKHFSLLPRYLILSAIFSLSLLPLFYFSVRTYQDANSLLELQIQGNQYQSILKKLIDSLSRHQALTRRYLKGQLNVSEDLSRLHQQIDEYFQSISSLPSASRALSFPLFTPTSAYEEWKKLTIYSFDSVQASDHLHQQLLEDTLKLCYFLEDQYDLLANTNPSFTHLILSSLIDIPHLQALLYQMTYNAEEPISDRQITLKMQAELLARLAVIELHLHNLKDNIALAIPEQTDSLGEEILSSFHIYKQSIQQLIQLFRRTLVNDPPSPLSNDDLMATDNKAINSGVKLGDLITDKIDHILKEQQTTLRNRFWLAILLTLMFSLTAFAFGLWLCRHSARRLKMIKQRITEIIDGKPAMRLPITYHDEIGFLEVSINHLKQRMEGMILQFHELLRGIHNLATGNLSIRLNPGTEQKEFSRVSHLFNQMAQTYEVIIGRLEELGFTLTNSANQIAAGSKEQETIIIAQEATTREIAVAANEISSTAKEYANTLKDISQVAEQTSHLAVTGKNSLTNMEAIMRQMVNASGNIATKLAVLNEKAGNITNVITTITKVADQTNLLSLNASIEAEKAGEYGRSFAVIAREIRRLADQTAVSTLDIERTANEIMTAVSSSVMSVDDFTQEIRNGVEQISLVSGQLATIMEQVQNFIARFETVNEGMQAQSTGAEQINQAINQLSQTAQQIAQSIHQFHRTIEELNLAANQLRLFLPQLRHSAQKEETMQ